MSGDARISRDTLSIFYRSTSLALDGQGNVEMPACGMSKDGLRHILRWGCTVPKTIYRPPKNSFSFGLTLGHSPTSINNSKTKRSIILMYVCVCGVYLYLLC